MKLLKNDVRDYVVIDDRKKSIDEQTVFQCQMIDVGTLTRFRNSPIDPETQKELLTKFLVGWKNMIGEENKQIPFDCEKVDDMIAMIHPRYRTELTKFMLGMHEKSKKVDAITEILELMGEYDDE